MLYKIATRLSLLLLLYMSFLSGITSCKKFIEISPPVNSITTAQVFSSDAQINSALAGIYTKMSKDQGAVAGGFSNGAATIYCGLSSDELMPYTNAGDNLQFSSNFLLPTNGAVLNAFWSPAYFYIYQANSIIEGLTGSSGIDDSSRSESIGEAKFIRAFCYFYLTNLFGDVPLALTTNFNQIAGMARTPQATVYKQIVQDLQDAQSLLATDYSVGGGERIRPNKWTAKAMLARTYLYQGQWDSVEVESSAVINNSQYGLVSNLNNVFDKNSSEAIWQLQLNVTISPFNGTYEGGDFIPYLSAAGFPPAIINSYPSYFLPQYFLSTQLVNSFEVNDQRMTNWTGTVTVKGIRYYYPYKYVVGPHQQSDQGDIPQYYMMLRLAEQYLIRAEARAQLGRNLIGAANDLDSIRVRAGLPPTTASSQSDLLIAIQHERQTEFFAEWGHRWLDLKRTGQANYVLGPIKSGWDHHDQLYPIPQSEMLLDPVLTQNSGY